MPRYDKNQTLDQLQGHIDGGEGLIGPLTKMEIVEDETRMVFSTTQPIPNPDAKIAIEPYAPYKDNPNYDYLFEGQAWVSSVKKTIKVYRGNF